MSNNRYKVALGRLIENFKRDFLDFSREQYKSETTQNRLSHAGEFGGTREEIIKSLLSTVVPSSRKIATRGFILNANNKTSKEQDLIIYSAADTPILTLENTKFFPIETVVCVVQVKSVIQSKKELKKILEDLSEVKKLRSDMGLCSVIWRAENVWNSNAYYKNKLCDQVATFLICEKLNFKITPEEIDKLYEPELPAYLKHNLILDIKNGLYGYKVKGNEAILGTPSNKGEGTECVALDDTDNGHISNFLVNLNILAVSNTIFHPDMGAYIDDNFLS
jgi:hypothetical protein